MFDVGFWELVMIGVVALVVVGPERLPRMARVAGLWLGRGRRILGSVKAEIDRELKADELKEILRKQAASNPLTTILEDTGSMVTRSLGGIETGGGTPDAVTKVAQGGASAPVHAEIARPTPLPTVQSATASGATRDAKTGA